MTAWEYRIEHTSIRMSFQDLYTARAREDASSWERIQRLGLEGWEMVSAIPLASAEGASVAIAWVFKRSLLEATETP